jgi:hypothetical protein
LVTWPYYFGPVEVQYIIARAYGEGNLFISWYSGSREREEGARVPIFPLGAYIQLLNFLSSEGSITFQ